MTNFDYKPSGNERAHEALCVAIEHLEWQRTLHQQILTRLAAEDTETVKRMVQMASFLAGEGIHYLEFLLEETDKAIERDNPTTSKGCAVQRTAAVNLN